MRIDEIDKNLFIQTDITEPDIVWLDVKNAPFVISGIIYDEEQGVFVRMPQKIADQVSHSVGYLNSCTAGGRVRFRTNSEFIGIHAITNCSCGFIMPHMTLACKSGFDMYRKKEDDSRMYFYHSYIPNALDYTGEYSLPFETDGAMADYVMNFPLYDGIKELYIALKKDAVIEAPTPYKHNLPVVFYGNSVTQGGCASRPGNCYQGFLSRWLDMDYINLGFSGSGRGEAEIIQYIADLEMSVFVADYDKNAPDIEHLRKTHLPMYRIIREKQPNVPIVFMSSTQLKLLPEEHIPRREVILETYRTALSEGDKNVYFLDGEFVYGEEEWDACTVDDGHPNDLGFIRIASYMRTVLEPLLSKDGV